MAFSKAYLFPVLKVNCSFIARCLSHPARIHILEYLRKYGETRVEDLRSGTSMSQSGFSKHLDLLRRAGLIIAEEQNPYIIYRLDERAFEDVRRNLNRLNDMFRIGGNE